MNPEINAALQASSLPGSHTGPAGSGRIVETYPGGWTLIERDGVRFSQHPHTGARMGALGPDPFNPTRMVIAIEAGIADRPGVQTEALLFGVSADGLVAMAAALLAAAADLRDMQGQAA